MPQAVPQSEHSHITEAIDVVEALETFRPGDEPIATQLRTSERVLARVTDGIYRRPGSALRELISNAYDADASMVIINCDTPRFDRITISDDGRGMSPEVLEHLIHNIGGSAKRTRLGVEFGMASDQDPSTTKKGRPFIGKVGIGLFSVAQLTQSFQISTKVAGDEMSTVAQVLLKQYSDSTSHAEEDGTYEAGKVLMWREPASDKAKQGTTITLTSVRPQTRAVLQSKTTWEKIAAASDGNGRPLEPPLFHVGLVTTTSTDLEEYQLAPNLPWEPDAGPEAAFKQFASAPRRALRDGRRTPQVQDVFDEYLQMIWRLGLAAPLPYVGPHPFDLTGSAHVRIFRATGRAKDEAPEIELQGDERIRDMFDEDLPDDTVDFKILVDGIDVRRPIDLSGEPPATSAAFQTPLLFAGHYRTEFSDRAREFSGGPLEFSAYLYWSPKLIPGDHRGVLIRVNEASGTLFDPDFLGFPINEQRRLPQISCEIFVREGFDGALNIDRESFNHTHPHVIALTRWFHGSLRQLINTQKRLSSQASAKSRSRNTLALSQQFKEIVEAAWALRQEGENPPPVHFASSSDAPDVVRTSDSFTVSMSALGEVVGPNVANRRMQRAQLAQALVQLLMSYDFFTALTETEQTSLVNDLLSLARVYLP